MKRIDDKKTLAYAVAFYFGEQGGINFSFRNSTRMYQHVKTVYDNRSDGRGYNTLEVVYDYKNQKYILFNMDIEGKKEITIL